MFFKFAIIDCLGCVVFTTLLFMLGFGFSASASHIVVGLKRIELLLLAAVIVSGLIFHLAAKLVRRQLTVS